MISVDHDYSETPNPEAEKKTSPNSWRTLGHDDFYDSMRSSGIK